MRQLVLLAGAAALVAAAPGLAKPGSHGKGHGAKPQASHSLKKGAKARVLTHRFGHEICPPGLAKKPVTCVPPGQVGRTLAFGARVPTGWGTIPFTRLPFGVRDEYGLTRSDRYIYRNGTLYVVDPRTRLVERIIAGLVL